MLSRRTTLGLLAASALPLAAQAPALPDDRLTAMGRSLAESLLGHDVNRVAAAVAPDLQSRIPASLLTAATASLQERLGDYVRLNGPSTIERVGGHTVVVTPAEFTKGAQNIRITLNGQGQLTGLYFAPSTNTPGGAGYHSPSYVKPDLFTSRDVTVGSGEWVVPGTLLLPKSASPCPAILLVQGSGPGDRDETIGPNKPFRDVAEGLASLGIAVLRYDKRTRVHGRKIAALANITVREETIADALLGIELLRRTPGIDSKRVFLLGHSLGGLLAPAIAQESAALRGVVIWAGGTRPLPEAMREQLDYLATLPDNQSPEAKSIIAVSRRQAELAASPKLSIMTPAADLPSGVPASYWLDLRRYHPVETAAKLNVPLLLLQGGRDYNVTATDWNNWHTGLASRARVTFKDYPKGDHYLFEGEGKAIPKKMMEPSHVPALVVEDIATWIKSV